MTCSGSCSVVVCASACCSARGEPASGVECCVLAAGPTGGEARLPEVTRLYHKPLRLPRARKASWYDESVASPLCCALPPCKLHASTSCCRTCDLSEACVSSGCTRTEWCRSWLALHTDTMR